jgi:hypothetical protein
VLEEALASCISAQPLKWSRNLGGAVVFDGNASER